MSAVVILRREGKPGGKPGSEAYTIQPTQLSFGSDGLSFEVALDTGSPLLDFLKRQISGPELDVEVSDMTYSTETLKARAFVRQVAVTQRLDSLSTVGVELMWPSGSALGKRALFANDDIWGSMEKSLDDLFLRGDPGKRTKPGRPRPAVEVDWPAERLIDLGGNDP